MIFFSRQMSERLQKMGCKSESGFLWVKYTGEDYFGEEPMRGSLFGGKYELARTTQAFFQNDLTGCHEQALVNAMRVWSKKWVRSCGCVTAVDSDGFVRCCPEPGRITLLSYDYHRHAMLDAPDAEKYLEETLDQPGVTREELESSLKKVSGRNPVMQGI